jgi:hypothetical protein
MRNAPASSGMVARGTKARRMVRKLVSSWQFSLVQIGQNKPQSLVDGAQGQTNKPQ